MNKKPLTAAELAAKKELETKRASELAAKQAKRREEIKKKIDLLSKADKNTVTAETKSVLEMIQDNVAEAIADAFDEMDLGDTADRLEEIAGALNDIDQVLTDADLKNFKQTIDEKLLKVRGMIEKQATTTGSDGQKSVKDFIAEKASDLSAMKSVQNGSVAVQIKMNQKDTPAFIGVTSNVKPQPNPYLPAPTVQAGVVAIVHPRNRVLEFIWTQPISTPSLVVTNEVSGKGDFNWTAEGALKPFVDFEFKTETVTAKKLAAFSKASREALSDISFLQAETERIITDKYERKLSNEVFNGDGTLKAGATDESIFGLDYYAPAYVQTCLNGKIQSPELSEVLFAAATQIRNLGFEGAMVAFVNPCDWAAEMMRKNTLGELLEMNKLLDGITVVPTVEVDPGDFLVGDLSVYTLYVYENFMINYGYENDDFRRNLVSLVAESRVFGFIPENHKGALCKDTIDNVKSLIAIESE